MLFSSSGILILTLDNSKTHVSFSNFDVQDKQFVYVLRKKILLQTVDSKFAILWKLAIKSFCNLSKVSTQAILSHSTFVNLTQIVSFISSKIWMGFCCKAWSKCPISICTSRSLLVT